ncbi:hypothetical protein G3N94_28235 [Burkholderia sp. Ac-20353]|nr:hypothetical protein [Burkholderia sp. Ac-20353]MBN3790749.1 hypothetical protein [Burkholderia sp. Ac-20353]
MRHHDVESGRQRGSARSAQLQQRRVRVRRDGLVAETDRRFGRGRALIERNVEIDEWRSRIRGRELADREMAEIDRDDPVVHDLAFLRHHDRTAADREVAHPAIALRILATTRRVHDCGHIHVASERHGTDRQIERVEHDSLIARQIVDDEFTGRQLRGGLLKNQPLTIDRHHGVAVRRRVRGPHNRALRKCDRTGALR